MTHFQPLCWALGQWLAKGNDMIFKLRQASEDPRPRITPDPEHAAELERRIEAVKQAAVNAPYLQQGHMEKSAAKPRPVLKIVR